MKDHSLGEWYRVCRNIDLGGASNMQWMLDFFGAAVLRHSPIDFLKVGSIPKQDGPFNEFMPALGTKYNMFSQSILMLACVSFCARTKWN